MKSESSSEQSRVLPARSGHKVPGYRALQRVSANKATGFVMHVGGPFSDYLIMRFRSRQMSEAGLATDSSLERPWPRSNHGYCVG